MEKREGRTTRLVDTSDGSTISALPFLLADSCASFDQQSALRSHPSLGVIDPHSLTRGCITRSLKEIGGLDVVSFTSSEECLEVEIMPKVILYHAHYGLHYSDAQWAPIAKLLQHASVIILSADDSPEAVVAAFACGVRGYIPTASTPIELALQIICLVRAGGTFVPPSGLSPLRSDKDLTSQVTIDRRFTPRQMAVLDHLTLGKANKIIAYELSMSESTVKVHIRNIMKKMNASNRTEVACRARAFVDAQMDQ